MAAVAIRAREIHLSFAATEAKVAEGPAPRLSTRADTDTAANKHAAVLRSMWRPIAHLRPPNGWLNDPCAPLWLESEQRYFLGFQWNPVSTKPEQIGWGRATSRDLVNWTVDDEPMLMPSESYDKVGCWTGAFVPSREPGELTIAYTGCCGGPIRWDLPYPRGAETVALAVSHDGGRKWRKLSKPFITGPPTDVDVCGFRDPQVFALEALSAACSSNIGTFGLLSGGLQGGTPCAFVYSVGADDVADWRFISTLTATARLASSPSWYVPLGANWEVASLFTLPGQSSDRVCLTMGIEGAKRAAWTQPTRSPRTARYPAWLVGRFDNAATSVDLRCSAAGLIDHGLFYACQTFLDAVGRRIVIGWILEDDLSASLVEAQGWAGVISLPRQVSWQRIAVTGNLGPTALSSIDAVVFDGQSIETLHNAPAPQCLALRGKHIIGRIGARHLSAAGQHLPTGAYEVVLDAQACEQVSLIIGHSAQERTRITYNRQQEQLVVDRSQSTISQQGVYTANEVAPFTLFQLPDGPERLRLRVFVDVSIVEIFANDRLALTTRVYPAGASPSFTAAVESAGAYELDVWQLETGRRATL